MSDDIPNGRHGNFAAIDAHRKMSEHEKPTVDTIRHLSSAEEYIIRIDHLQFGGPVTRDELLALRETLNEMTLEADDA